MKAGITTSSASREKPLTQRLDRNLYKACYKQGEKYLQRRKMRKLVSTKAVQKNSREPSRHKSEKLSPKEDCKSLPKPTQKRKPAKPKKCSNCGEIHAGKYQQPMYKNNGRGKKTKGDVMNTNEVDALFGF